MSIPAIPSAPSESPADALVGLADEMRREGPVIAPLVADPVAEPALGLLVAAGPRCAVDPAGYATVVEAVREGWLLHYGEPRLLSALDPDLRLLIGDYLYARGIEQLAAIGDRAAVDELSDLISLTAQLDAAERAPWHAAEAAWLASAVAIAAGSGERHEQAKDTLRASGDAQPLWNEALATAAAAGLSSRLAKASEAVGFPPSDLG